jgi:hypothetical protein
MTWDGGTCRFAPHCMIHDGSRAGYRKGQLTLADVRRIRDGHESTETLSSVYMMSMESIRRVRRRQTYRSVT